MAYHLYLCQCKNSQNSHHKMMQLRVILILFLTVFFCFNSVVAQRAPTKKERKELKKQKKRDKLTNIEFIENKFSFALKYKAQTALWRIKDKVGDAQTVNYIPNVLGTAGGQISIKGIAISYLHKLPVSKTRQVKFGNTEYQVLYLGLQSRMIGVNFYYTHRKGFYLDKPDRYDSTWVSGDNFPHRPDLKVSSLGFKTHLVFNKRFSIKAAFSQTERQKTSAGSFMITFGDHFMAIESDSSLIPASEQTGFGAFSNFSQGNFNTFYGAAGIGFSLVKGNFNFTPILLLGAGIQAQFYSYDIENKTGLKIPLYFQYRNSIGINGEDVFARLIYSVEYNSVPFKIARMEMYYMSLEMCLGFRL